MVAKPLALSMMLVLLIATLATAGSDPRAPVPEPEVAQATHDRGGDAVQSADEVIAALEERVAYLESVISALGGAAHPAQNACPSGIGCFKVPGVVDESGDTMFGDLNLDRSKVTFIPEGALDGGPTQISFINGTGANLSMPVNYFSEFKLLEGSRLNTTNLSEVFIDFLGNLTFADGSFLNPFGSVFEHDVTYKQNVTIFENITIHEGGTVVFQNNTSIILSGSSSRIGTEDETPFVIVVNNTSAITIYPQAFGSLVEVNGSVVPEIDDFYALGSPTNRWDALYMASRIDFANDLLYTSGGQTLMTMGVDGTLEIPGRIEVGTIATTVGIEGGSLENGSVGPEKLAAVCLQGQVLKVDDGEWACREDEDTQYGAGPGLMLEGSNFTLDTEEIQSRITGLCPEDEAMVQVFSDGTVACSASIDAALLGGLPEAAFLHAGASDTFFGRELTIDAGSLLGLEGKVRGDIVPFRNDESALGSSSNRFSDLFLASVIHYASTLDFERGGDNVVSFAPDGSITSQGSGHFDGNLEIAMLGGEGPDPEIGFGHGADLRYAYGPDRFEFSHDVAVPGGPLQVRVSDSCAAGKAIQSIASDGTVTCETAGDTLQTLSCTTDQIIKWSGSAWVCTDNTMPGRPGPGRMVAAFDADRDVSIFTHVVPAICFFDDDGDGVFDAAEPLYLIFAGGVCAGGVHLAALRLTTAAGFAAFTKVRGPDADLGQPVVAYNPTYLASFFDADGSGWASFGDWTYADRDGDDRVSVGDYRWVATSGHAAGTVVRAADGDLNSPITPYPGGVSVRFWDINVDGTRSSADIDYLDIFNPHIADIGDVRLGDLASV